MTSRCFFGLVFLAVAVAVSAASGQGPPPTGPPPVVFDWDLQLAHRLHKFGHRNWIAVVDAAYPDQASPGIETMVTGANQLTAVEIVLSYLDAQKHVRPVIYLDAELDHVPAADAEGINQYRADLFKLLRDRDVKRIPHASIIEKLDAAGGKFKVLVLKTNLTLPYTSVFIELDCGYWSPEAEARLRAAMEKAAQSR
jgi:hypothetical protein